MPRLKDYKKFTDYEIRLYEMSDDQFLEYATKPEMNELYNGFSEADKTAFLIRAMMLGDNPLSLWNDLQLKRNNMYNDGPDEVRVLATANKENPDKHLLRVQYKIYKAILYSDKDNIRQLASKTTDKLTAEKIIEEHAKLKEVFTAHLQVPMNEDYPNEVISQMISRAEQERDSFLKSLGYKNYDEGDFEEEDFEEDDFNKDNFDEDGSNKDNFDEEEEHVYVPLKNRPVNINAVEDEVAKEEFAVADKNGNFNVVIKPLKEGEEAETLLDGYDLKETSAEEKRNMLFSYVLQGMGKLKITNAVNLIQKDEQYRNLFDLCVLVMDSKEIRENKELIKNVALLGEANNPEGLRLYGKANAFARKKKIENPFLKKEEEKQSDEEIDVNDSLDYMGYAMHPKENNNLINNLIKENDDFNIYDQDFNIERNYIRPDGNPILDLPKDVLNANVWIDRIKEDYNGDSYRADVTAARILAARILVDSERGSLKSLKKPVSGTDIDQLSKKLLENKTFQDFLGSLGEEEKRSLLSHRGHGGVFEDKFKKYLLKLEAGKLHNDRILDRFMPKAYQRIEELQRQAAKKGIGKDISKEAAEVILIRAMIGIGRNQPDKLAAKIPTFSNLAEEVDKLSNGDHPNFVVVCNHEKVKEDFQKGHGGLMIENMYNSDIGSNEKKAIIDDIAPYCTAKYRYKKLQERAKKVLDNLKNNVRSQYNSIDTRDSCMEAKEVLAEAVVMSMSISRNTHKNKAISPTLQTIQTGTEIIKKDETFNKELFPNRNPVEFATHLKAFVDAGDPERYADDLFNRLRNVYLEEHSDVMNKANKIQRNGNNVNQENNIIVKSENGKGFGAM